ncbi:GNAT family N-acetyltransferase [Micromonospora sp. MS34]|uniref:GNAT family N-acetyltransferase n=1 Tax=Micromonospora sp. MS34 TaxID=3385971 RepID=UPI0039A107AA
MPVRPRPEDPADSLLLDDDGTALARMRLRDDAGTPVAAEVRPLPGAARSRVAAQARRDLAGYRLETSDEAVADALLAGGLRLHRAATDLRHVLADVPEPEALPAGWSLGDPGWDEDLAEGLAAAYGPGHPDGPWQAGDTEQVRAMFEAGKPVPPLLPASARLVDRAGRSAGHVLCAGPVPWTDDVCAWVLNLAVAPRAQGRGFGRALLTHALRGAREAGLPAVGLSVADGNPARRMYDAAGFRPYTRVLSVLLPLAADPLPDQRPAGVPAARRP